MPYINSIPTKTNTFVEQNNDINSIIQPNTLTQEELIDYLNKSNKKITDSIDELNNQQSFQIPNGGIWKEQENTFTWVTIEAFENYQDSVNGRLKLTRNKFFPFAKFKFLLQDDFSTDTNISWESYKNWATELNSVLTNFKEKQLSSFVQGAQSGTNLLNSLKDAGSNILDNFSLESIGSESLNILNDLQKNMDYMKMYYNNYDAAYTFKSTSPREISFNFDLMIYPGCTDRSEVWNTGRLLEKLSLPTASNSSSGMKAPPLFKITISRGNETPIFKLEHTALRSVKNSWSGPWIYGFPSKDKLTLNFSDIQPLFQNNYYSGDLDIQSNFLENIL